MPQEYDIRHAVRDTLLSTGVFDAVWTGGLDEPRGRTTSEVVSCGIAKDNIMTDPQWDTAPWGAFLVHMKLKLQVAVRHPDPDTRDSIADDCIAVIQDKLNGKPVPGITVVPDMSYVRLITYDKPTSGEIRLACVYHVFYLKPGWDGSETNFIPPTVSGGCRFGGTYR